MKRIPHVEADAEAKRPEHGERLGVRCDALERTVAEHAEAELPQRRQRDALRGAVEIHVQGSAPRRPDAGQEPRGARAEIDSVEIERGQARGATGFEEGGPAAGRTRGP